MNYTAINEVIILALIMMVGVFARKKNIIKKETTNDLSNLLVNITLPALLVSSFDYTYSVKMLTEIKRIFIYSFIINLAIIFLSKFLTLKYDKESSKIIRFATTFSNSGFMGYPVLGGLFGKIGIFYGAIFNMVMNIVMFTIGITIYSEKGNIRDLKGVILNPAIISTILGFLMFLFSIKLPHVLITTISTVGSMTTPLSMIIVGAMLAEIKLKDIFRGTVVYYLCFLRLVLAPTLSIIILRLIKADSLMLQISVVIEAMPVAVLSPILAQKYNSDRELASRSVFITTIVSVITIPVIIGILQHFK